MPGQPTRGRREVYTRSGTAAPPPTWTSVTGWPTSWTWRTTSSSLTTSRSWGLSLEASRVSSSQDESSLLPTVPFRGVMTSETCGDYRSSSISPSAPPVRLRTTRKLYITSVSTCLWPECIHLRLWGIADSRVFFLGDRGTRLLNENHLVNIKTLKPKDQNKIIFCLFEMVGKEIIY